MIIRRLVVIAAVIAAIAVTGNLYMSSNVDAFRLGFQNYTNLRGNCKLKSISIF